jgi:hypothetical protein
MPNNVIRTTIDPKDFRANYRGIKVLDCGDGRDFEVTATTEIINEDYDPATKMFVMEVVLHYPGRSTRNTISLAIPARKDGKLIAIPPPNYMLTQEDFEAVMRGEVIKVPAHY